MYSVLYLFIYVYVQCTVHVHIRVCTVYCTCSYTCMYSVLSCMHSMHREKFILMVQYVDMFLCLIIHVYSRVFSNEPIQFSMLKLQIYMEHVTRFWPLWIYIYITCIVSYSNRYIFCKVYTIDVLFSPLYTTPFLYVLIYFSILHKHSANSTRSDAPCGSKLPHLQIGAFKSLQIGSIRRGGVLSLLICSVCYILSYPLRRYRCAKLMYIFPVVSRQSLSFCQTASNSMYGNDWYHLRNR